MISLNGKITEDDVWKACEKIFSEGKPVTNERVREELRRGSYSTIGKFVKSWKERPEAENLTKDYLMPEHIRKFYEQFNQSHWNAFVNHYELIVDNEKILELEKENESLRDKLEIAKQDSIRLEELKKVWKEEKERYDKAMEQQRLDAAEIQKLRSVIEELTS